MCWEIKRHNPLFNWCVILLFVMFLVVGCYFWTDNLRTKVVITQTNGATRGMELPSWALATGIFLCSCSVISLCGFVGHFSGYATWCVAIFRCFVVRPCCADYERIAFKIRSRLWHLCFSWSFYSCLPHLLSLWWLKLRIISVLITAPYTRTAPDMLIGRVVSVQDARNAVPSGTETQVFLCF